MLHAEEIGIGSGRLGLWLVVCAFVLLILKWPEWPTSKGQKLEGREEKGRGLGGEGKSLPLRRAFSFLTPPPPLPSSTPVSLALKCSETGVGLLS